MDIKEYISSGIIESYVLGLATEQEANLLECVRKNYPEVEEAILEAQTTLEDMAMIQAIAPAKHLREDIWNKINKGDDTVTTQRRKDNVAQKRETVISGTNFVPLSGLAIKSFLVAAGLLLAVSIGVNIYLYRGNVAAQKDLAEVGVQKKDTEQRLATAVTRWEIINKPAVKSVLLQGTPDHSDLQAKIYWNTEEKSVYLIADQLPPAPDGMQYQLWAIVDGNPVDAGLVPLTTDAAEMFTMRNVSSAEAFAITMEKVGGSPVPTLSELRVIGNI